VAIVGAVKEIWRFPFKSMAGEQLERCTVTAAGIVGDRGWAARDETAKEIRGAKKIPALLRCRARYVEEPRGGCLPPVEITLPGGKRFRSDAAAAASSLSTFLGRPVTLWPLQPATNLDHYRRGIPDHDDLIDEMREILGRLPGEPMPDLSLFPPDLLPFAAPPGAYYDLFPLHLLTTASLRSVAERAPGTTVDVRRFRPNILIELSDSQSELPEVEWYGRTLRIGPVAMRIDARTVRCVMPSLPQEDLAQEPAILRTIVRDLDQHLGVYASITSLGELRVSDPVELL
jgi:uncharacterized protein YcbX